MVTKFITLYRVLKTPLIGTHELSSKPQTLNTPNLQARCRADYLNSRRKCHFDFYRSTHTNSSQRLGVPVLRV